MLSDLHASLINGRFLCCGEEAPRELINPATEEPFHAVYEAGASDVDVAANGAFTAWETGWRDWTPGQRAEVLFRLAALIEQHAPELGALETRSMGKPLAASRDEALAAARTFRYYAGAVSWAQGEVLPVARGGFDFTLRQPLGVVSCIIPWNFPLPIFAWKVAPALAAGNCVLLKPAPQTPLGALAMGRLALEAGLPPGVLQVLCGEGVEVGEAMVRHPLVRKVSFTGSTAVGRRIQELAGPDFKRLSLELGGKSPNIVFADADWELAAQRAPGAIFDNSGQDCCARSRVFVERAVYDRFLEIFVEATGRLRVGDPMEDGVDLGPVVSEVQHDRVEAFVTEAKQAGRTLLCGGTRPERRGFYVPPTIITGVETGDRCWREEIFGPVACVRPFDSEDEMLREVNASPYGLSGSIWTRDLSRALRVSRRVESGVLSVNSNSSVHLEAPFGGHKQSGIGRDLGRAALESFSEIKNVYIDA